MVSIEDERLPRRKQPEVAPLTAPTGGNSHQFKRVDGRTYSVCTVCGVLMRTPAENAVPRAFPRGGRRYLVHSQEAAHQRGRPEAQRQGETLMARSLRGSAYTKLCSPRRRITNSNNIDLPRVSAGVEPDTIYDVPR